MAFGYSNRNIPDENGVIEMRDAIQLFHLTWNIEFIIINNSEHTAYYPKIELRNLRKPFNKIDTLNENEPIASKSKVVIKGVYEEIEEAKGTERNKMIGLPPVLRNIDVILEYKNSSKTPFYTYYNAMYQSNDYSRKKPKD